MGPGSAGVMRCGTLLVLLLGLLVGAGCTAGGAQVPTGTAPGTTAATPLPAAQSTLPPAEAPPATSTPEATATPGPPVLKVEPAVLNLAVGQAQRVEVRGENLGPLAAIELHLSYEPGYVQIEDSAPDEEGVQVELGTLPQPAQVGKRSADNASGVIVYQVAQDAGDAASSSSGLVTGFTVRALAEGGSPLRFTIVSLSGADGQPLPTPDQIDGLVVISNAAATAEPGTAEPSPAADGPTPTAAPVPTTAAQTTPSAGPIYHTVQAGENVFRLALRYGTTVDAIVAANGLGDAAEVRVGQVLLIPTGTGAPQTGEQTYVVQPGDTLFSIARRHNTTVQALAALNGLAEPYAIRAGQVLRLAP